MLGYGGSHLRRPSSSDITLETSQEVQPKRPFSFEAESLAFGLRERARVRRMLLRQRVEIWIGTIVVVILAACAVWALMNTRFTFSDNPSIQGFRSKH